MTTAKERLLARMSAALFILSLIALLGLSGCSKDDDLQPDNSAVGDDHGSGGHGADDPN
ncbi:MAG: hypothetical protein IPJ76_18675 [Flavobacteriales bacterium]|nr:MAG: hypothetical protein IPJ76_18675 [Flavobacteriales bacterium]